MWEMCRELSDVDAILKKVWTSHKDIVSLLLSNGANSNQSDEYGWTPLHNTAEDGDENVVALLIAHKVDVDISTNKGETPLYIAADKGHLAVISQLLNANADSNIAAKNQLTPLMELKRAIKYQSSVFYELLDACNNVREGRISQ
ncbi:hypothetical protein THRCLA_03775 [Thraustotheca clavata]|uniref:Uncharacterized protein n=1 Tax=Thraustotheca clavata TaxID=74557 RepID=A0A1W0A167_9STRA|nr:hypothetical protein THRCLA_03775 [Thraustotheca clavata]